MIFALILFILTYALMIILPKYRLIVVACSASIFILFGFFNLDFFKGLPFESVFGAIDYNVLMILFGTMGIVAFFIDSKMPNRMADWLIKKSPNVKIAIVVLSVFAGIVSAFVDNVATVLMIAPVGLAIAKKLKISPVEMLICISLSSNLQGAATLVGDTTSVMLASEANMNFMDFLFMNGKFSIFWFVELGALCTIPVILFLFRKLENPINESNMTPVNDYFPTVLLLLNIVLLIVASFIPNKPDITNGLICTGLFIIGLVYYLIKKKSFSFVKEVSQGIDFATIALLACLFIVIGGIKYNGVIDKIAEVVVSIGGDKPFLLYSIIVWGSVIVSAFVDNIPYVATMLPIVTSITSALSLNPIAFYFGLLSGATLGGNITPVGASANITTIGILKKEGYEVKNKDFFKIGIPFTLVAVTVAYVLIWIIWA